MRNIQYLSRKTLDKPVVLWDNQDETETKSQYGLAMSRDEELRFREYLIEQGLKFTAERRTILAEVFRRHEHFEAEDIVLGLRASGSRVSRASVYRALPHLVGSGLLRPVHSAEKHGHYEHVFGHDHHDHLICSRCGATIEFKDNGIEKLQERVCVQHDFKPTNHRLEIIGVCASCREGA